MNVAGDAEIWRRVTLLVERYGEEAAIYAARQANALGAAGDLEGKTLWKRIMMGCLEWRRRRAGKGGGERAH